MLLKSSKEFTLIIQFDNMRKCEHPYVIVYRGGPLLPFFDEFWELFNCLCDDFIETKHLYKRCIRYLIGFIFRKMFLKTL